MNILEILFNRYSVGFFIQLTIMMFIFVHGFEKRDKFVLRLTICVVVSLCACYFYPNDAIFGFLKPFFLVTFLNVCLLFFLCYKIPFKHTLFYCAAMYAIENLSFHIYAIFCALMNLQVFDGDVYIIVNYLLSFLLSFLLYFFVVRKNKMELDVKLENKTFIGVVTFIIFVVFVLNSLTGLSNWDDVGYILMNVFLTTCGVLSLLVLFGNLEQNNLKRRNAIMEQILHVEQQQHQLSKQNIELINLKCHDMKHQLSLLKRDGGGEDHNKVITEIEKAIMIYDSVAKTGNDALDVILTEKSLYCENYEIKLAYIVDGKQLDFMVQTDVYSLFGNALDNAIESVLKIEDRDKRVINLNVCRKNMFLLIHMDNYFSGDVLFIDGIPQTTKEDRNFHGFGLHSISYIAEKYNGKMNVMTEGEIFNLDIVLPEQVASQEKK